MAFQGNAELLSISSDDSIWNSGDEDDGDKSDTGQCLDRLNSVCTGLALSHQHLINCGSLYGQWTLHADDLVH